ncbi:MAG: hypothetical protein KGJ86_01445 [Chloroflexota bacterium]|nr:hypothetical protein [Chloroflexota bacterium]
MERIFWVECAECHGKFYCDYALRHAGLKLICPYCANKFLPEQAASIDERQRG